MKEQTTQNTKKPTKICLKCKRGLHSNAVKCTSCGCTDIMDKKQYKVLMEQYEKSSYKEKQELKNSPDFTLIAKYQFDKSYNEQPKNFKNNDFDNSFKSIVGMLFIGLAIVSFIYGIVRLNSVLLGFIFAIICLLISYYLINGISQNNKHSSKQTKEIKIQEFQTQQQNIPKCPICQSTNLSKITNTRKAGKIVLFGIFGAGDLGKTWKCNNCGSKF